MEKPKRKSSNAAYEFVLTLTREQRDQIISDYDLFSLDGSIGDCELRRQTEALLNNVGCTTFTTMWFDILCKECFAASYYGE